jgi:uncharacterized protein YvpB
MNKEKKPKTIGIVLLSIIIIVAFVIFVNFKNQEIEKKNIELSTTLIASLYQDESKNMPKMDINSNTLNEIYASVNKVKDEGKKIELKNKVDQVSTFISIKNDLYNCFDNDILKTDTTISKLDDIRSRISTLPKEQQTLLNDKLIIATTQLNDLNNAKQQLRNLYQDDVLTTINDSVTRDQYNDALNKMKALPQTSLLTDNQKYFDAVDKYIVDREAREEAERQAAIAAENARRQAEAARQAAIAQAQAEAIKKEQEEKAIQDAYVELNISVINQKDNGVYNGCEAAALLMALKYRGYASDYNLKRFADEMPKSESDPHQGFIHSIYDLEPTSYVHWIAPDALATYGNKFASTTDVTGLTGDGIKSYIDKGIPVVVYATYGFRDPIGWDGPVPLNLHVMLVIGYNKITGAYVINDPWANKIIVKKDNFERAYNLLHYAVVVN